jgi:uncharacterized protein (DUF1697 family)
MAAFREILASLGYTEVQTLLNSGNAAFTTRATSTAKLSATVQKAISASLGLELLVVVKSEQELGNVVRANKLLRPGIDASRLLVALAQQPQAIAALSDLRSLVRPPERIHITAEALYLWCPLGSLASKAGGALLGKLGRSVTTRNWATILKLNALVGVNAA